MTLSESQIADFKKNGYLLIKNVFSKDTIERVREYIEGLDDIEWAKDISRHPPLIELLVDDNFVATARGVLEGVPVYFGKGTIFSDVGKGVGGFHHDAKLQGDDRRNETFPIVRFAIFLQDHASHSGGIKMRNGSHHYKMVNANNLMDFVRKTLQAVREGNAKGEYRFLDFPNISFSLRTKTRNVPSEIGDVVAFNLRTYHCGRFVRLRGMPNIVLPPLIEKRIPKVLAVPRERSRYAVFIALAKQFNRLNEYIVIRAKGPDQRLFKLSALDDPAFENQLRRKGIAVNHKGKSVAEKMDSS